MSAQELYIFILNSNVINFIIMIVLLVVIFKKFKLGSIIDSLADDIKNNVTTSAEAVQNAINAYKKARKESRNIDSKKNEIIDDAKNNISKLNQKSQEELQKKKNELDSGLIKTKAVTLDKKIQKTAGDIKEAVYLLSKDTVKTILNEDMHNKIIADCLDELDGAEVTI